MSLQPGTRVGPYEIVAPVGAGGMGEVYRARDARLDRDVAIKILPGLFSADAERLARFDREAKTLASLNHPNIAQIYAIEQLPGATGNNHPGRISALVMELVEGEDLSARIARGATPIDEAVPIARQIADALEAAHERGIIHRDLKPANVKVREDGAVKVLDFGLAKALDGAGGSNPDLMNSPTITSPATHIGMILGTAAYMSPEQAKGRAVDKRADVWAFGAVLYEMLTGRRAFEGDDVSTTMAAVLMRDPDWTALPSDTPPAVVALLRRCLERDARLRLRDIGEARVLLSNAEVWKAGAVPTVAAVSSRRTTRAAWALAAAALAVALLAAGPWLGAARTAAPPRIEAAIAPPSGASFWGGIVLSPDGRRLAFTAIDNETGVSALWLRDLGNAKATKLPQTDGSMSPFWSPDGTHIAFFADGKLKKADRQGTPPQVICDAPSPRGGAWGPDNRIVFASTFRAGLEIVSAEGGKPEVLTNLDASRNEKSHRWPVFLPGGKQLLFVAQTSEAGAKDDGSTIEALSLEDGSRTRLVTANSSPVLDPNGYLLFWRDGALRAQAFDADALTVSGAVFPVASGVAFDQNEYAYVSVARDGSLVYLPGTATSFSSLLIVDRTGRTVRTIADPVLVEGGIALSHDGNRLAASVTAAGARDTDIWVYDLRRDISGPLTLDLGGDYFPVWSADDAWVIYTNTQKNDGMIYRRSSDGVGEPGLLAATDAGMWASGISRNGDWLLAGTGADQTSFDVVRVDIAAKKITPLVQTTFSDTSGALSPGDRWLAYTSEQTGRREVYVRGLAADSGRWQISMHGGSMPLWSHDGRELYYLTPQNRLMSVGIRAGTAFSHDAPRELFHALFNAGNLQDRGHSYQPLPGGNGFVIDVLKERTTSLITLVTNWTEDAGR